jgi:hypothetical protein
VRPGASWRRRKARNKAQADPHEKAPAERPGLFVPVVFVFVLRLTALPRATARYAATLGSDLGVRQVSSVDGYELQQQKPPRGQPRLLWGANLIGRIGMLRSKLAPVAVMMLLSAGFVLFPQDSANAAKFCAQLRGSTAAGEPNCSFSTLDACRARVRHLGGGHCYKLTH